MSLFKKKEEPVSGAEDISTQDTLSEKKPPRFKRWKITAAVVAIVVVIAGAGMFAWHETPGFCNDICHNSMDGYLPTYESELGKPSVDKWGNEVADASGMLSAVHRTKADIACLQCHEPTLVEQASEGIAYITGGYYAPLSERNIENLTHYRNTDDPTEFCLNEKCHNMTKSELSAVTENRMVRNVHSWHHFQYTCTDCHKAHRASVLVCTTCHEDSVKDLPTGWITAEEAKNLKTIYGAYDNEA